MLLLNEQDIMQAITMNDAIQAIEEAYILYDSKLFHMPLRTQIQDNDNTLLLMPCIATDSTGLKIVNVYPNNQDLPATQGTMILHNRQNGAIKGILNGTLLTGIRTGAIGGTAIKYLANEDSHSVGLIGTGYQGLYQLLAACAVRDIRHIYLWNRTQYKIPAFIETLKKQIAKNIEIHIVDETINLVEHSDIIITSTTSSEPVLPNIEKIYNGKLIIGIGSYQPKMREFSDSIYNALNYLYVDTLDAKNESGDVITPLMHSWLTEKQVIPFSKVITNEVKPVISNHQPTVFKSTGMALFDLVVANRIVETALRLHIGQNIEL
ncbi:MAG: ornithine cyclodeaminase family protein [Rummeliibacillus sp.]